jgi:hypothetical protein
MSEAQVKDVELDTDGVEESSINVEEPVAEESSATPEVDLGYTEPVSKQEAKVVKEEKKRLLIMLKVFKKNILMFKKNTMQ